MLNDFTCDLQFCSGEPYRGLAGIDETTVGFSQLAAALLAAKHFNTRNATLVPEISNLPSNCTVTLEISKALNAIRYDWTGIRSLKSEGTPACAMVGPYDDHSASDLTVMAQASSIPFVMTRNYDVNQVSDISSQYTTSVHPVRMIEFKIWFVTC